MKKYLPWVLIAFICFVFIQSLFFKFTDSLETQLIFGTIADWMTTIPILSGIAEVFAQYGGYVIGTAELIVSALLLVPRTRVYGALLGLGVITGAIFFHVFTPLGMSIVEDLDGNKDGGALFFMACLVWFSCAYLAFTKRRELPFFK